MGKKILLFILLLSVKAFGQTDTTRVLFIGNSFTYVYDVPTLVKGLATAAGLPFKFVMYAPGGISVGDSIDGINAHMYNPAVFDLIRADNWDFVSLQDKQGRFMYGYDIFVDTNVSKIIEGHIKIRDSVKAKNPCAHMLWFAGWGPKNGYPGVCTTDTGMIDNIYMNYKYLRDTAGEIISPIGIAWERATVALPAVDLWGPDLTHQSLAGSFLTASVIFTSIFRINTENINYTGGLDSVSARTLRQIAYQTVIDSIVPTNLNRYIPDFVITDTTLTATNGYSFYYWYKNGLVVDSGSSNTWHTSGTGCFFVIAIDSNGCKERSVEKCLYPTKEPGITYDNDLKIYPVPAKDVLEIASKKEVIIKVTITDLLGRVIKETEINSYNYEMPISELAPNIYYIIIASDNTKLRRRFIKME